MHDKYLKIISQDKILKDKCLSIKVFGSSITGKATKDSDIDLFIELKDLKDKNFIYQYFHEIIDIDYDIAFKDEFIPNDNSKLYQKMKGGVELIGK